VVAGRVADLREGALSIVNADGGDERIVKHKHDTQSVGFPWEQERPRSLGGLLSFVPGRRLTDIVGDARSFPRSGSGQDDLWAPAEALDPYLGLAAVAVVASRRMPRSSSAASNPR
jgi:hypothetical protein